MKNSLFFLFSVLFISSCTSLEKHNSQVNQLVPVEKLKKDVDFAYHKLQKLQPALYWYVSKEQLEFKFDSLKTTITKPLTSYEFYKKITPVVNEIRQGHLGIEPNTKISSKKELKESYKKGMGPLSQLPLMMYDDKLYVAKNNSLDSTITVGSQVISIDSVSTDNLVKEYRKLMTSDGYNTTFYKYQLPKKFSQFYVYENGIKDSLLYQFKYNDSIKTVWIKRKKLENPNAVQQD